MLDVLEESVSWIAPRLQRTKTSEAFLMQPKVEQESVFLQ